MWRMVGYTSTVDVQHLVWGERGACELQIVTPQVHVNVRGMVGG
jgi:hypothetical protein